MLRLAQTSTLPPTRRRQRARGPVAVRHRHTCVASRALLLNPRLQHAADFYARLSPQAPPPLPAACALA